MKLDFLPEGRSHVRHSPWINFANWRSDLPHRNTLEPKRDPSLLTKSSWPIPKWKRGFKIGEWSWSDRKEKRLTAWRNMRSSVTLVTVSQQPAGSLVLYQSQVMAGIRTWRQDSHRLFLECFSTICTIEASLIKPAPLYQWLCRRIHSQGQRAHSFQVQRLLFIPDDWSTFFLDKTFNWWKEGNWNQGIHAKPNETAYINYIRIVEIN